MKKIECIIMDWAGTAVDYGCFAPVAAFMKAFAEKGLSIDVKQTRKPMGLPKIQHIRELLTMPEVNEQFISRYQRSWAEEDVVGLNRLFEEYLFASLEEYTDPIPGVIPTLEKLRTEGLKIGSTTGYTREMMDVVLPAALAKGYCVDYCATPNFLPAGRPAPYMIFENMIKLGAVALPLLAGLGCILNNLPKPTAEDRAQRVERVTLNNKQRWEVFRSFAPVLTILFFANLFLTVLQDVKEDFLVKIINVDAAGLSSWAFAKVDGVVTLIILAVFASLALMKSHIKVLSALLVMVIIGAVTLSFVAFNYDSLQLPPLVWLFIQSLCLYFSYLSFQTIFFDRFIACFRIKGNVGFFIAMIDSIGYTGTVLVLVCKEFFNPDLNWLEFYNTMAGTVGAVCCVAFTISLIYLWQRYRKTVPFYEQKKYSLDHSSLLVG